VRNWAHFKERRFANPLSSDILKGMPDYAAADLSASDRWMSRCVSISMKLGWKEEDLSAKAEIAARAVKSVL
jgi:hypothetical protein